MKQNKNNLHKCSDCDTMIRKEFVRCYNCHRKSNYCKETRNVISDERYIKMFNKGI